MESKKLPCLSHCNSYDTSTESCEYIKGLVKSSPNSEERKHFLEKLFSNKICGMQNKAEKVAASIITTYWKEEPKPEPKDIFHQAYINLITANIKRPLRKYYHFAGYLYKIEKNIIFSKMQKPHSQLDEEIANPEEITSNIHINQVFNILSKIDPKATKALFLKSKYGYSNEGIAQSIGIVKQTVSKLLNGKKDKLLGWRPGVKQKFWVLYHNLLDKLEKRDKETYKIIKALDYSEPISQRRLQVKIVAKKLNISLKKISKLYKEGNNYLYAKFEDF
jgi:RNA polymerase sigma factor (sigma-70 family)